MVPFLSALRGPGKILSQNSHQACIAISCVFSRVLGARNYGAILSPNHNELLVSLRTGDCGCSLVWNAMLLKQINKPWGLLAILSSSLHGKSQLSIPHAPGPEDPVLESSA